MNTALGYGGIAGNPVVLPPSGWLVVKSTLEKSRRWRSLNTEERQKAKKGKEKA